MADCTCVSRGCYECNGLTIKRMGPRLAQSGLWYRVPRAPEPVMEIRPRYVRKRQQNELRARVRRLCGSLGLRYA